MGTRRVRNGSGEIARPETAPLRSRLGKLLQTFGTRYRAATAKERFPTPLAAPIAFDCGVRGIGSSRAITLPAMLKITLHDSANELRFRLEGRLCGAWVVELRQCWLTAQSTTYNRNTTVDLSEVDYVDSEGQSLLTEMFRHNAILKAVTPLIRAVVQEIERSGRCATVERALGQRSDVLDSAHPAAPHRRAL